MGEMQTLFYNIKMVASANKNNYLRCFSGTRKRPRFNGFQAHALFARPIAQEPSFVENSSIRSQVEFLLSSEDTHAILT
ncbi:MAG: hypothetical protein OXG62_08725 [Nitrospinae bacterium]|nr:hypothetical protein [Nitrospinota bacterium]